MPRRKQTTINLKELECYPTLLEELRNNLAYSGKDLTTLKLTVLDSSKRFVPKKVKIKFCTDTSFNTFSSQNNDFLNESNFLFD